MSILDHISARAKVPEQIIAYIKAISQAEPKLIADCLSLHQENAITLIAYPLHDPHDTKAILKALNLAIQAKPTTLTVLSPINLPCPPNYKQHSTTDFYTGLPLPYIVKNAKLRNMLKRAKQDIEIIQESWTKAHTQLISLYLHTRALSSGTRHIFSHLHNYAHTSPSAKIFSAYNKQNKLMAFSLGEYASLSHVFYMAAFRAATAPPGTADALLMALLEEGVKQGHSYCNLGLNINHGIAFFKHKWQVESYLPCVETVYTLEQTGLWKKIIGCYEHFTKS